MTDTALSDETKDSVAPATRFIKIAPGGRAYIEGHRCNSCGAVFLEARAACSRCGGRAGFSTFEASDRGMVYTYTVVYRSYPGIKTPFISVIVDLDDGLVLKGTLRGVEAKPSRELFNLPVRMVFKPADDHKTAAGVPYVTYFFEPA